MRTTLLTTGLAALMIATSISAIAAGPGRGDHDPAQGRIILVDDDDDDRDYRNRRYGNPWPYIPPYGYPGYGNGGYGNWWGHDNRWGYGWGNGNQWGWHNNHRNNGWGHGNNWGNDNNWGNNRRLLPNHVVRAQLERQRFHDFSNWKYKDGYYKVYAEDRHGRDVKLVIDPYTGRIVDLKRR